MDGVKLYVTYEWVISLELFLFDSVVRVIFNKIHFIVMDVYFILKKLCYFISMRIYMSYVCI